MNRRIPQFFAGEQSKKNQKITFADVERIDPALKRRAILGMSLRDKDLQLVPTSNPSGIGLEAAATQSAKFLSFFIEDTDPV